MFLGLIGVPTGRLTWEAFKVARAAAGIAGAVFTGASAAATAGLLLQGALVVGTGLGAFFIARRILDELEPAAPPPLPLAYNFKVPVAQGNIRVLAFTKPKNGPRQDFDNIFQSPLVAPVIRSVGGGVAVAGVLSGPSLTFTQYVGGAPDLFETMLEIISVTKQDGTPVENLKKVPGIKPLFPAAPVTTPTFIPIPNEPDFPITPTVVPNPDNEPEKEGETREPGVIVQVPELGLQFNFGLDGVRIDRYKAPNTEPFDFPKIPAPPGTAPPANDPCPCPEGENKDEEIICRIKSLQEEILDDGETLDLRLQGPAQCLSATGFPKGFRYLETSAATFPSNVKRIRYPAPGSDSVFLGNIQFEVNGALTEPIPIRAVNQIELAPDGSTGYVVSGIEGSTTSVGAYIYTKKPYIDAC